MKKPEIVVIGTIIKETIKFPNRTIGPVIGSPAAYASLVMAAQGRRVGIVTYYGKDMENIISELDVLDHSGILDNSATTTNLLVYREDGSKYVEYQYVAPDIHFENICKEYLEVENFKICPMNYEVDIDVVKQLYKMGKTVFVDLGGYGGATSDIHYTVDKKIGKQIISDLCKNTTIIKASEEDLQLIMPGKTPEEAVEYMVAEGAQKIVVTLGSKGVLYREKGQKNKYEDPFTAVSEIEDGSLDFTGAGDSFGAGFMASYIVHRSIPEAALNGNATASLVIQRTGGCTYDRMPSSEKVQRRRDQR